MSKLPLRPIYSVISHLSKTPSQRICTSSAPIRGVSSVHVDPTLHGLGDKSSTFAKSNSEATNEANQRATDLKKRSPDPLMKQEGNAMSGGEAEKGTIIETSRDHQQRAAPTHLAVTDTQSWNDPTVWAHLW
jgi:hypothetical protein